jgi:hypothetical protein
MSALFPTSANTAYRLVLLAGFVSSASFIVGLMVYVRTPWNTRQFLAVDQPVQFDHRHHVVDDEIPCLYCHRGAESSAFAGVPPTSVCMGCHAQIWSNSALLEPVRDSYFSGLSLEWNRVHALPEFVYFNHAVHVQRGLGCAPCHGRVERMARVYAVAPLTMDWCLDCHRAGGAIVSAAPNPARALGGLWGESALDVDALRTQRSRAVTPLTTCTACHR